MRAAAVLLLTIVLASCQTDAGLRAAEDTSTSDAPVTSPVGSSRAPARFSSSGPLFDSVAELSANSDLVVVGTVQSSEVGAVLEAEDPEFPTRELHTVLELDGALKGAAAEGPLTVATLELAYAPAPNGLVPDWRQKGTRVLAFLKESNEGSPFLYPTSYPQSFYIIQGEALLAAYQESDEERLSERIEEMSFSQLRAAVEQP